MKLANPETFVRFVRSKLADGDRSIWSLAMELSAGYGDSHEMWQAWLMSELAGRTWLLTSGFGPAFVTLAK